MNVSQTELDLINSKIRLRVLEIPVLHGRRFGELKRCPVRRGDVRTLKARVPYATYRQQAGEQPSRARAVLWLMDRCDITRRSVTVTVTDTERKGDKWVIRFEKGDWRAQSDRPVYLARNNDFTMIASQQTVKGDPELASPFAKDLERARAKAGEKRSTPIRNGIAAMKAANRAMALRNHDLHVQARRRLKLIEKETEKLAVELAVDSDATLAGSDRVQSQSVAAANGDCPPSDIASVVSLESAA